MLGVSEYNMICINATQFSAARTPHASFFYYSLSVGRLTICCYYFNLVPLFLAGDVASTDDPNITFTCNLLQIRIYPGRGTIRAEAFEKTSI